MIAHAFALGKRSLIRLRASVLDQMKWGGPATIDDQFGDVYYVMEDGTAGIATFPGVHALPGDFLTIDFSKSAAHKKFFR